jgi:peptidoglycan/LPS O-acetylase OafA/YrhL
VQGTTISTDLRQTSQENNLDLLRFLFASSICIYHLYVLSQASCLKTVVLLLSPLSDCAVRGFFIISGFLIFRSYERSRNLKEYLFKRARRILPAYVAVVVGCAATGYLL